jgi:glycosyltransferase involved in cell wall biosynthesis
MKIGFVVGQLGRGGAEIQLMRLAEGLALRSHEVEVFAYSGSSPLDGELEAAGVRVRAARRGPRLAKLRATRRWVSTFQPDLVQGIMKRASSLAVLSRSGRRTMSVVATDMSTATYRPNSLALRTSLLLFGLADRVVTQTELNRASIEALAPWLRGKVVVIRNGVDTERFIPAPAQPREDGVFRFCVVGSVYPVKNPEGVVRAVKVLRDGGVDGFRVDWFGRLGLSGTGEDERSAHPTLRLARELGVDSHLRFHGQTECVERELQASDALLHASVQEGFPNAVVEGMACGLPLVVSRVSDLPLVVSEARNGVVFDEKDPHAIAAAMEEMMRLDPVERSRMATRSRELAVRWFGLVRFVDDFERLYQDVRTVPA